MTYSTLVSSLENNIFIVTINRPEKLNALNAVVLAELALAVEEIYNNPLAYINRIKVVQKEQKIEITTLIIDYFY